MIIKVHAKHHKDHTMTHDDFISNLNVEPILVNLDHILEITPFDESEINRVYKANDYLYGSKSSIWFDHMNSIKVIEDINELEMKIGALK